jgi:hypothetical protein
MFSYRSVAGGGLQAGGEVPIFTAFNPKSEGRAKISPMANAYRMRINSFYSVVY